MRRIWTTRLVFIMGTALLAASVLSAAVRSAATPPTVISAEGRAQARSADDAPPAKRPPVPGSIFSDDFALDRVGANPPAGWTVADGLWDGVVNGDGGHVIRHSMGRSYGHVVAGTPAWTNYTVTADLRPTLLSTGFAGVAARYQDGHNYYACGVYYASAVRLWRVRGGAVTLLDARIANVDTKRFHTVRLVARGTQLGCTLDGTTLLSAVDASFASGRIALLASDDEAAEFGDVGVST
jgi:hypothetical protein